MGAPDPCPGVRQAHLRTSEAPLAPSGGAYFSSFRNFIAANSLSQATAVRTFRFDRCRPAQRLEWTGQERELEWGTWSAHKSRSCRNAHGGGGLPPTTIADPPPETQACADTPVVFGSFPAREPWTIITAEATDFIRSGGASRYAGSILGYLVSSQFAGLVVGPLLGGFVGSHLGMRAVFLATAVPLGLEAACTWAMTPEAIRWKPSR